MKRTKKIIIELSVLLILMALTFYFLLKDSDIDEILASIRDADWRFLALGAFSMVVYTYCGGWCIRVLLHGLGKKMSFFRCFKYSLIEIYFSAITPSNTGGQPMQLVAMTQDGYSFADGSVILLVITALYKFALLALAMLLFPLNSELIGEKLSSLGFLFPLGIVMHLLLIGWIIFVLCAKKRLYAVCRLAIRVLARFHIVKDPQKLEVKAARKCIQYRRCSVFMRDHPALMVKTFGVLLLQRVCLYIVPYLVYLALGHRACSIFQVVAIQLVLSISVDMLPLPGAMGVTENGFLALFTSIFGSTEAATTAVLLSRGLSFYLPLLISGLAVSGMQLARVIRSKRIHAKNKDKKI